MVLCSGVIMVADYSMEPQIVLALALLQARAQALSLLCMAPIFEKPSNWNPVSLVPRSPRSGLAHLLNI